MPRLTFKGRTQHMTVKQWGALNLPVAWSIYNESENPEINYPYKHEGEILLSEIPCSYCGVKGSECDCHNNLVLDLDAPVPDGVYMVTSSGDNPIWEDGVRVKNGTFVPESTAEAIYRLVVRWHNENPTFTEAIDHCFVDSIEWNGVMFEVFMGS